MWRMPTQPGPQERIMPLHSALQGMERMECDTADDAMCIRSPVTASLKKFRQQLLSSPAFLFIVLAIKLMPPTIHNKAILPVLRWR